MRRKVICCDAFELLSTIKRAKAVITSLPDAAELRGGLAGYQDWFTKAAVLIMNAVSDDGVAIFYQTDRRHDGILFSKGTLLCNAAHSQGLRLLWHKVVLKRPVGTVNTFRPSYAHMMAFSKLLRSGKPTPDVIEAGKTIYRDAMGVNAALVAVRFAIESAKTQTVYDPFCGRGTVLAVANSLGCNSIGCDTDESQCRQARKLVLKMAC